MTDPRDSDPYRPPLTEQPGIEPKPGKGEGALSTGILLAWCIMVLGYIVLFNLGNVMPAAYYGWFLPPLVVAILAVVLINRGVRRTGRGLLLGLLSVVAVLLLLVAACFGLVMVNGGLRNL